MPIETPADSRAWRSAVHRALGDDVRLAIVDALRLGDRTPGELIDELTIASNLLAHHLDVLEDAGVVSRHRSSGDGRRRYVSLVIDDPLAPPQRLDGVGAVLFVCSRNAARSQLAAALWTHVTGTTAFSAGAEPAARVDPGAVEVAAAHGLALDPSPPTGYDAVPVRPDLVVSVCDRACEQGLPFNAPRLHWSVVDPHGRGADAYEAAYDHIRRRVHRLAAAV